MSRSSLFYGDLIDSLSALDVLHLFQGPCSGPSANTIATWEVALTRTVTDAAGVTSALVKLAQDINEAETLAPVAIVGIRRGGEHVARRLAAQLEELTGTAPALGMVDITLYRDDGFGPNDWPDVGITEIPFRLREHTVILVDDVLFTGRTVRSALGAILDYGRPRSVRLAVLVDRGHRELPIQADFTGLTLDTALDDRVDVLLTESGAEVDSIIVKSSTGEAS